MTTIEQLVEALMHVQDYLIGSRQCPPLLNAVTAAIAAGEAELRREPVAEVCDCELKREPVAEVCDCEGTTDDDGRPIHYALLYLLHPLPPETKLYTREDSFGVSLLQVKQLEAERDAAKEKIDILWIQSADRAAKIDCLTSTLESRERNIEQVVEENKRMEAEIADVTSMYNRCVDDVHAVRVERNSLKEGLDGWHSRYLDAEVERDAVKAHIEEAGREVLKLVQERDALRATCERARGCIDGLLKRTPVRGVAETLAEIDDAIGEKK